MRPLDRVAGILVVSMAVCAEGAFGGAAEPGPPIRDQMRRYLAARLVAEAGLSEGAIDALMPRLEALERTRAESRRERVSLVRDLRRGVALGASDAELEALLIRLDDLAIREAERTRQALSEIDRGLSVRQRVQVRFVLARSRGDLARRVEQLGGRRR